MGRGRGLGANTGTNMHIEDEWNLRKNDCIDSEYDFNAKNKNTNSRGSTSKRKQTSSQTKHSSGANKKNNGISIKPNIKFGIGDIHVKKSKLDAFKVGRRVVHLTVGEGTIVKVSDDGFCVKFDDIRQGIKSFHKKIVTHKKLIQFLDEAKRKQALRERKI